MDTIQYDKLILTTILAAKRAGEAILDVYKSDFGFEKKDNKSYYQIYINLLRNFKYTNFFLN